MKKEFDDNYPSKLLDNLEQALAACNLSDGMTVSFHHHLREGDFIVCQALKAMEKLGLRNMHIAPSSLNNIHACLIEHIKKGVVTGICTSGLRGELAQEISKGNILTKPVVFRSHGGRARAICQGELKIDLAIISASMADSMGNCTGKIGKSAFGSMGYALVDADFAKKVIIVTDDLVDYPLVNPSIDQTKVNYVVEVEAIGDIKKIASGATRNEFNDIENSIAENTLEFLKESGIIKEGFSFQAGSGGASLATLRNLKVYLQKEKIKGSFMSGGITTDQVELLEANLFNSLLDTQTFDAKAVYSISQNNNHSEMSASMYANPSVNGAVVDMLDVVILSATEADLNFNVNVITGSHGLIIGAIGGHPDTAEGAEICIVTVPLLRKGRPIIRQKVTNLVTKGEYVDAIITDVGIAINPLRKDLIEKFSRSHLPIFNIKELYEKAQSQSEELNVPHFGNEIVGIIEDRRGGIIDVIRKVEEEN